MHIHGGKITLDLVLGAAEYHMGLVFCPLIQFRPNGLFPFGGTDHHQVGVRVDLQQLPEGFVQLIDAFIAVCSDTEENDFTEINKEEIEKFTELILKGEL